MERFSYLSCKLHQESFRSQVGTQPPRFLLRKENNSVKKGLKGWRRYNRVMRKAEKTITVLKKHALTKMLSDVFST